MNSKLEEFGKDVGAFLRGVLGKEAAEPAGKGEWQHGSEPAASGEWGAPEKSRGGPWNGGGDSDPNLVFPADYKLWADMNNAPKLIPGHLLVVHLATSTCYQVDPATGNATLLFTLRWGPRTFAWRAIADTDGTIYCSVSGTLASVQGAIPPGYAPPAARFNYWGAIVQIDHRRGKMRTLVETKLPGVGEVLDPHGIQFIDGNRLLVADFQGFEPGGCIYAVDKRSGDLEVISKNGLFTVPVSALMDSDGVVWVANADMTEENDGEIIRIEKGGRQSVFLPPSGKNSGQVVGLLQSYKAEELIVFRCEWPNVRGNSAVFTINKKTKKIKELFRSRVDDPRFYNTNGDVSGKMLWFGESVHKEIIGYNLETNKIETRIDFRPVAGGWHGMLDSYDGIESVTVIPPIKADQTVS